MLRSLRYSCLTCLLAVGALAYSPALSAQSTATAPIRTADGSARIATDTLSPKVDSIGIRARDLDGVRRVRPEPETRLTRLDSTRLSSEQVSQSLLRQLRERRKNRSGNREPGSGH